MIDRTGLTKNEDIFCRDIEFEINYDGSNYSISTKGSGESVISLSDLKSQYSAKRSITPERVEEILNLWISSTGTFYSVLYNYNNQ